MQSSRQSLLLFSFLAIASACEPEQLCDASRELDFSEVGLKPGSWTCAFGASVVIDEMGRPREVSPNPLRTEEFGCRHGTDYPLTSAGPNVQAGSGETIELIAQERRPGYVRLEYAESKDDDVKRRRSYYFRMAPNGTLSYARSTSSYLYWQECADHPVPGKTLGSDRDDDFSGEESGTTESLTTHSQETTSGNKP